MPRPGLLLVEALPASGLSESSAEPFPFIAGYAEARGFKTRWVCFGAKSRAAAGDALHLDLTPAARRALLRRIDEAGAGRVLFSEAPAPVLARFLARERSGLQLKHCAEPKDFYGAGWLADWLDLPSENGAGLPDLAAPLYRAEAVDPLPAARRQTPLIGSAHCLYAAPLAKNPAYRGVDLSGCGREFACSFCPGPSDLRYPYRTPALELALRQITAARGEPGAVWSRTEFVVRSGLLFHQMSRFVERLERGGVPPVALYFSCRADEVLKRAKDVRAALLGARRAGHTINVFSMGVENFSPAENERFNKRLSFAQIRDALALLRGWEREFPETFFFTRHGGLGFILFTPWTTLDDLKLNLEAARELGLTEDGFLLSRRLMLFKGMPITRLAERDGLVDPAGAEERATFEWLRTHCDPGCRHFPGEEDRPWRFQDPAAGRVCALAARLAKSGAVDASDPYHGRLREAAERSGVRLLDAVELLAALARKRPGAALDALAGDFIRLLGRLPSRRRSPR